MNFPKITEVIPKDNMILFVKFENGITKKINIAAYGAGIRPFEKLQDSKLFHKVRVENGGHVIVWDKTVDMDGADAWEYGEEIEDAE